MLEGDPGWVLSTIRPFCGLYSMRKKSNVSLQRRFSISESVPSEWETPGNELMTGALLRTALRWSKFNRDRGNALWRQLHIQLHISLFVNPRLRFFPCNRRGCKLLNLQRAQVFQFAQGPPKPARICMIFIDSFDPCGARPRRARQPKVQQFRLDRMPGHCQIGHQDGCGFIFTNHPRVYRRMRAGEFQQLGAAAMQ